MTLCLGSCWEFKKTRAPKTLTSKTHTSKTRASKARVPLLSLFCASSLFVSAAYAASDAPRSFVDLTKRLAPAVVNISTTQKIEQRQGANPRVPRFFEDFFKRSLPPAPNRERHSLGSGFIMDPSGLIVTNNHVIEGASSIEVVLSDGTALQARLLGSDAKTDIALLKVENGDRLPYVSFGDSTKTEVGEWVMAIGNPFGFGGTVTAGIVSALNRDIGAGPYDDFIQTDASINRGSSGGPLFNMEGEVIGVNTVIISPSGGSIGIGFAVPSKTVREVIDQLRRYGETRRGWLGVKIQTVTPEMAEGLGLEKPMGALVAEVTPNSPAQEAGVQAGDVILSFNGTSIETMRDLPRLVAAARIESLASLRLVRQGQMRNLSVRLGRLEDAEKEITSAKPKAKPSVRNGFLGLSLQELNDAARQRFNIPQDVEGVLISNVEPNSVGAQKRIGVGSVILQMAQKSVLRPRDVFRVYEEEKALGRENILILLWNAGNVRFLTLPVEKN